MERTFKIIFTAAAALAIAAVGTICLFLIVEGTPAFGKIGLWRFLAGCSSIVYSHRSHQSRCL